MRVERSSLDQVKRRFEMNKKRLEERKRDYDLEQRMKEIQEEVMSLFYSLLNPEGRIAMFSNRYIFCRFAGNSSRKYCKHCRNCV